MNGQGQVIDECSKWFTCLDWTGFDDGDRKSFQSARDLLKSLLVVGSQVDSDMRIL